MCSAPRDSRSQFYVTQRLSWCYNLYHDEDIYHRILDPTLSHLSLWCSGASSPSGIDPHDPSTYTTMFSDESTSGSPVLDEKSDDRIQSGDPHVAPSSHGEPIVTRRELWSYYCECRFGSLSSLRGSDSIFSVFQRRCCASLEIFFSYKEVY
jgi:hypothetical protein